MTKKGVSQMLTMLRTMFPNSYSKADENDNMALLYLWDELLKEHEDQIVFIALKSWLSTNVSGFPPTPGMILAEIHKLTDEECMTEQEAWNLVKKAIRNCDMLDPSKEYDKLPDDIKALVGSSGTLLEWACMDTENLHTVVASNFQRSYRTKKNREKEYAAIPESVKKAIEGAKNGLESRYGLEDRGALQIEA